MSVLEIVSLCLVIYFIVAAIIYLVTKEIAKSIFWIFYILGEMEFDDFDDFDFD